MPDNETPRRLTLRQLMKDYGRQFGDAEIYVGFDDDEIARATSVSLVQGADGRKIVVVTWKYGEPENSPFRGQ